MPELRFSQRVCEAIGCYVYLYIDPRDGSVFYIGKGRGNRAFAHLQDDEDSEEVQRVTELKRLGLSPRIDILKYNLSDEQALLVEATAIDLIDVRRLTNRVRGHGASLASRAEWRVIEQDLGAVEADMDDPSITVNIGRTFHAAITPQELYDATRSAWRLGEKRHKAKYVMPVFRSVIREVFTIAAWLRAGTTFNSRDSLRGIPNPDRWEFVGKIAPERARAKYVGKRVGGLESANQNPVRYFNCD